MLQSIKKYGIVFGILILLYIGAMTAVFCIPNTWIEHNVTMSLGEFDRGTYWHVDNYMVGTMMDGQTDRLMLSNALRQEENSVFYNALDVSAYPRYWHGYLVLLRPLLCIFKYKYIKYLSMILCFLLLCAAYRKVCELTNTGVGVGMVLAFGMGNLICIPLLMQYMSMYYITILSVLAFCTLYKRNKNFDMGLFFLVVGSVTNFFDFLTTPLISLGFPLVLALIVCAKEEKHRTRDCFWFGLKQSFLWAAGYGGTWLAKWCIASVVLQKNVLADAMENILYRTGGDAQTGRLAAIGENLVMMFPKPAVVVVLAVALVWLVLMKRGHAPASFVKKMLPLLCVACYPFVWYLVLSNHSQVHDYFTYRTLEVTVFAAVAFLSMCVRWREK